MTDPLVPAGARWALSQAQMDHDSEPWIVRVQSLRVNADSESLS